MTAREPQEGAARPLCPGFGAARLGSAGRAPGSTGGRHSPAGRPSRPSSAPEPRCSGRQRTRGGTRSALPARPLPLTLPAVGERGAAGRRGPAQARRLGVEDEQPEGDHVCRPAPRDTWHGAGGERRAGRLSGPRHGRAAPGAAGLRRRSPQGLRGAVPVSGFCQRRKEGCGEGAAPGSPRLGAAGVNAAGRTGPGQRRGRRGEAANRGCRPSPPSTAAQVGRSPRSPRGAPPAQGTILSLVSRRWSPLRGRGKAPRSSAHALAEVPQPLEKAFEAHGSLTSFPPLSDGGGTGWRGFRPA